MIAVDTTVVNLALPLIGRGLRAPVAGLQWTIAAYTITTASLMLSSGSIGDRFGRRTVLQAGLGLFTLASLGCSLAPSLGWLIAFRALQGAGGSALTPMSMGIITATFADPAARTRAIGMWSGTWGIGMVTGPALGGVLAAAWGWRSLFWVNILPGLIGIVLAGLFIPDSRAARPRRVDPPGQILVIVFLTCLTCGIIEGATLGWRSPAIIGAFAALCGGAGNADRLGTPPGRPADRPSRLPQSPVQRRPGDHRVLVRVPGRVPLPHHHLPARCPRPDRVAGRDRVDPARGSHGGGRPAGRPRDGAPRCPRARDGRRRRARCELPRAGPGAPGGVLGATGRGLRRVRRRVRRGKHGHRRCRGGRACPVPRQASPEASPRPVGRPGSRSACRWLARSSPPDCTACCGTGSPPRVTRPGW